MYRERLTITLDAALLQAVDSLIDGERLRNRSQTIEHLLREGVGLHDLRQAFVFPQAGQDLDALAALCAKTEIRTFYLCLDLALKPDEESFTKSLRSRYETAGKTCEVITVPSDFGSGGSLSLKKADISTPFLLAWPGAAALPPSLLPAFLFHRSHQSPLTELCERSAASLTSSGIYIASPELLALLPAGASDLQADVFPALLKEARVKGYFYST